jgi:hypothetical protein
MGRETSAKYRNENGMNTTTNNRAAARLEQQRFAAGFKRSLDQMMRIAEGKEKGKRVSDLVKELREELAAAEDEV